ncbi:MAG: transketolase-like TK C-terminal-containing protein, partial [Nevskiales bacterium]
LYAAYHEAVNNAQGRPTVILAKTVKGYGMGEAGEGQNITHQQKKMGENALKEFRDRFNIPIADDQIAATPFYRPAEDSAEVRYLKKRREALGGWLPQRRVENDRLEIPPLETFNRLLEGTGEREISTTMAFVQMLQVLCRDKTIGPRIVPIVPDEARTFGMEGMFRQLGIYSVVGQLYEPQDKDQLAYYREDIKGQILEEGITEAGAMSSWIAAGTSYANHGVPLIPFFIFYSMFGFQRIGDLCWAAGDMRTRGFLMGGTAGRTTLNGEGLQHEDGHSQLIAHTVPNCRAYDPAFAYELAVIIQHGMQAMYARGEDAYYYITVMNENYVHPAMPAGVEDGIVRGMYCLSDGLNSEARPGKLHVQLLGSGTILREVIAAAELLKKDWKVTSDVWSVTSFSQLARDGQDAERWNLLHPGLHPDDKPRVSYVAQCLKGRKGPAIAATDYMKNYAGLIRPFIPMPYATLGTDGFGRSDTRAALREFFEVDRRWITVRALKSLAEQGEIEHKQVTQALRKYGLNPDKPNPLTV